MDGNPAPRTTPNHGFPLPPNLPGRVESEYTGNNRYLLPDPETGARSNWARMTSITKILDDTYHLERWHRRNILIGMNRGTELRIQLRNALTGGEENSTLKRKLDDIADTAQEEAGSTRASEFGTAAHEWMEYVDHGLMLPFQVPELFRSHVVHYMEVLAQHCLTPLPEYTERTVLNTFAQAAGKLDRIYMCADGSLVLGDVKTSSTMDYNYLSWAMQLYGYQSSRYMLSLNGKTWEPMPILNHNYAVVLHVPSDKPEHTAAVPFDLAVGRQALELAVDVKAIRARAPKDVPNRWSLPIPSADTAQRHRAVYDLRTSTTLEELERVWSENQDVWTDGLTALGSAVAQNLRTSESES